MTGRRPKLTSDRWKRVTEKTRGQTISTLLLCSDGVHGTLDDTALDSVLSGSTDVVALAQRIVDATLERDASDNVTALVVRYEA